MCQSSVLLGQILKLIMFCSVSDLLDYINPSHNAKGKDSVAVKRKNYIMKVYEIAFLIFLHF